MNEISIIDTDPTKFNYHLGYIHDFEYLDKDAEKIFYPHPIKGNVYEILERDGQYILHIGNDNAHGFKGLFIGEDLKGQVQDKWVSDIELVTKENMLDLNLEPEVLAEIDKSLTSGHKGIKDELEVVHQKNIKFKESATVSNNSALGFTESLSTLSFVDRTVFDQLNEVTKWFTSDNISLAKRGVFAKAVSHEAFIGNVQALLDQYTDIDDLSVPFKIIESCIYELHRRKLQNEDNEE